MKKISTSTLNLFTVALLALCFQFDNSCAQTGNFGLNLDGVDDRCSINDNAAYDLGTGNFTIEAWIKASTTTSYNSTIIGNRETISPYNGFRLFLYNGKVYLQIGNYTMISGTSGADLRDNYCHQVAVTRSGNSYSVYVDGAAITTITNTTSVGITSNHQVWLGRDDAGGSNYFFKGLIHEVRFWNLARTQSQIQSKRNSFLAGNESGLIGYWRMNENTGQTFNDYSAINNDGFLGTVTTADAADPVWAAGCYCTPLPPVITAGGPTTFCNGGSVLLTSTSGTGYQWKNNGNNISGATSQTYSATSYGNYSVEISAGAGCVEISNKILVTVDQALSPTITSWFGGFCSSTIVTLETNYSAGYIWQWFEDTHPIPNATDYQMFTGHNGNYSVTVTNTCGSYSSGTFVLNDPSLIWPTFAIITANGSTNLCTGGSVTLETYGFYQNPVFQWYKNGIPIAGANNYTYTATQAGNYCMSVYDNDIWCGQTPTVFSNWITVTTAAGTYPSVSISTGNATTFCAPGSALLQSTASGSGPLGYQWTKDNVNIAGATNTSYTANISGSYRCLVTNPCATASSNAIVVSAQTLTATITTSGTSICTGSSRVLSCNQQAGNSYQWKLNGNNISGATSYNYSATAGGNFTCTIANLCGTVTSNTLTMTLRPLPTAAISGTQTICSGDTAIITVNFTGTAPWYGWIYNGSSYTNFNTSSNPFKYNYFPTSNTTYTLYSSLHDLYCYGPVSGSAVVTVTGSLPVANITPAGSTTFCNGGSVLLNSSAGTGYAYLWKKNGVTISGATTSAYSANASGSYTVRTTNACGSATSSAVTVTVNPNPSAAITPSGAISICSGQSITLSVPAGNNKAYQWKKGGVNIAGATASSYVASLGGNYKATVTNTATGCSSTSGASAVITKNPLPAATITPQGPTTFCAGGSVLLKGNFGTGFIYQWKKGGVNISGATNKNYTATIAGIYKIQVTDANGCSKLSAGVTVTVPCKEGMNIETENPVNEGIDFIIYPNPSAGEFTIEFADLTGSSVQIEINDAMGRVLEKFETKEQTVILNRPNLASGIYYLTVRGKDKMVVKKFSLSK